MTTVGIAPYKAMAIGHGKLAVACRNRGAIGVFYNWTDRPGGRLGLKRELDGLWGSNGPGVKKFEVAVRPFRKLIGVWKPGAFVFCRKPCDVQGLAH